MRACPFEMCTETRMEQYRHDTLFTKEPETIAWLDHFGPVDVFYDVGANVGVYSLYAGWLRKSGLKPGLEVCAFEPVRANFERLCENGRANRFGPWFHVKQVAVGSFTGKTFLSVPDPETGASGAQMLADDGEPVEVVTIDHLVENGLPPPDHVKIDIDGQELEVIQGMQKTLAGVKSVLVEVSSATKAAAIIIMVAAGLTMDNPFNTHVPHSRTRRREEGIDAANWVFVRR